METITEITDETTVGQIKQWIQSIRDTNPGLIPRFEIESYSVDLHHFIGLWDSNANEWICIRVESIADANERIRNYNPEQVRQNKITELKAQIAKLEGGK